MALQCLHIGDMTKEVASLLRTAHVGAGLKVSRVLFGALEYQSTPKSWLAANVPIMLVSPIDAVYGKNTLGGSGKWETTITMRIVHIQKIGEGDIWEEKVDAAEAIAETILTNYVTLRDYALTNGQVLDTRIRRIELKPPEDDFAFAADENLTAQAVVVEIVVCNIRNTA